MDPEFLTVHSVLTFYSWTHKRAFCPLLETQFVYPIQLAVFEFHYYSSLAHSMLLSCINNNPTTTLKQTLLVQDGKLYGQSLFSDVISRALSLPDIIGDKEFQMNEFVVQLGQVRHQDHSCFSFYFIMHFLVMAIYLAPVSIRNYRWLISLITLQLVINLLKILCTNIAWQRRKLGKSLQDWSTISIQVCEIHAVLLCFFFLLLVLVDFQLCFNVGATSMSSAVHKIVIS